MIDEYESIVTAKSAEDMLKGKWSSMSGIVRCKDCRFSTVTDLRELFCYRLVEEVGAEDYCSRGERKEDETD